MNEVFVITRQSIMYIGGQPEVEYEEYYACYLDKDKARRACVIFKHEDEISGDHSSKYVIVSDTIKDEDPEQDPGMTMSEEEILSKIGEIK